MYGDGRLRLVWGCFLSLSGLEVLLTHTLISQRHALSLFMYASIKMMSVSNYSWCQGVFCSAIIMFIWVGGFVDSAYNNFSSSVVSHQWIIN